MLIQSAKNPEAIAKNPRYKIVNSEERKLFFQEVNAVLSQSYPRFLIEDVVGSSDWHRLCSVYP